MSSTPPRAPPSRSGTLFWLALVSLLVASGPLIGGGADRWWTSAVFLHAEPLLMVWAVVTGWLMVWRGRAGRALLLVLGAFAAAAATRAPLEVRAPTTPPRAVPRWLPAVSACAAEIPAPVDEVRLLSWTVTSAGEVGDLYRAAVQYRPDILVIRGLRSGVVLERIRAELGAEQLSWPTRDPDTGEIPADESPIAVLTRGVFHQCADATSWDARGLGGDRHLMLIGVTPETTVPLLLTQYPGPWAELNMERYQAAVATDAWLVGLLGALGTVVMADAPSPRYRHLDSWYAQAGLLSAPALPNWPMSIGPIPLLPLHPYDRLWATPAWKVGTWERLEVHSGRRGPLIGVLEPVR